MSVKCTTCNKSCSFHKEPFSPDYTALETRHTALVEAVKWMLYIDTPENFEGGKHVKARSEVERLLSEEK